MARLNRVNFFGYIAAKPGRIAVLDGLRALAILLVLFRHGAISLQYSYPVIYSDVVGETFSNWMLNGWVGVDLFFVLSGFLLGYHLIRSWSQGNGSRVLFFGKYWLKRILRTFPLYYVVILIVALNIVPLYEHSSENLQGELIKHVLFLQDYYGTNLLTPLWSLATEEKFYLICPLLLWGIMKLHSINKNYALITLMALCLIPMVLRLNSYEGGADMSYSTFFWSYRAPFHLALDGLLMGLLVAYIYSFKLIDKTVKRFANIIFFTTFLVSTLVMSVYPWMSETSDWLLTIVALFIIPILFSILIYFAIFTTGQVSKILGSVFLRFISRISYSLYLVHMLVIPLSLWLLNVLIMPRFEVALAFISYFVIYILMSILFSVALHVLVERPFLVLKSKIAY